MSSRKEFLLAGAFASFVPANALAAAAPAPKATPDQSLPKFQFDKTSFDTILSQEAPHRQCFGATKLNAAPLQQMCNSMNAYEDFYGDKLHAVAVFYHGPAIALAMDDALWNDLLIPGIPFFEKQGITMSVKPKPGSGNPYLHAAKSANRSTDFSIETLVARGAHLFVCNNAVEGFTYGAAAFTKKTPREMYAKITSSLVKGASLVPAGVMAIDAAQAAKFTYLQSSL